jgi:hypothetical protein
MAPQDPEALARQNRVQRLCRELSELLKTSLEQRQAIDELLTRLEDVTRSAGRPLARAAGRSRDRFSRG